jgi:hypothetical protein
MGSFRQALLERVAPRLRELGYEWDEALRDRNLMYGFSKDLGGHIAAQVIFQRHQHEERASGQSFAVNLRRVQVPPGDYSQDAGRLDLRLRDVMRLVHGLDTFAAYDVWWSPLSAAQLGAELADALAKLEAYGITWLEDPNSRMPGWMPDAAIAEFRQALDAAAATHLIPRGYRSADVAPRGRQAIRYARPLFAGMNGFVEFGIAAVPGQPRHGFMIMLFRNPGDTPTYDPQQPGWLYMNLNGFLAHLDGLLDGSPQARGPYPYNRWEYAVPAELEAQMAHAFDVLAKIGLPWLEDPASTNDWRAERPRYERYAPVHSVRASSAREPGPARLI